MKTVKFLMTAALALAFAAGSYAYQPKPEPVNIPEDQKPEWMKKAERDMIEKARKRAEAEATKPVIGGTTAAPTAPVTQPAAPVIPPAPPMVAATVTATDADVLSIVKNLTGSFASPASGDQPALRLNTAVVSVAGLDNAIYFELSRADSPNNPFRSGVWNVYKGKSGPRLRVLEFAKTEPNLANMLGGLWAAPQAIPAFKTEQFMVSADVPLTKGADGWRGSATGPTLMGGAVEASIEMTANDKGISFMDAGMDATGKKVWGSAAPITFARTESPAKVQTLDGGVIVIDLVNGAGDQAQDGWEVAVQYTGWVQGTGKQFDSSRTSPERMANPYRTSLPGNTIPGMLTGLHGMQLGTVRRIVIPGPVGYAERGNRRAGIDPNVNLVFETECVYIKKLDPPPAPPAPAPGTAPAATPAGAQPAATTPTGK